MTILCNLFGHRYRLVDMMDAQPCQRKGCNHVLPKVEWDRTPMPPVKPPKDEDSVSADWSNGIPNRFEEILAMSGEKMYRDPLTNDLWICQNEDGSVTCNKEVGDFLLPPTHDPTIPIRPKRPSKENLRKARIEALAEKLFISSDNAAEATFQIAEEFITVLEKRNEKERSH